MCSVPKVSKMNAGLVDPISIYKHRSVSFSMDSKYEIGLFSTRIFQL